MKRTILFISILLGIAMGAKAHDFSAVSPSGHTLYYFVLRDDIVGVTYPNDTARYYSNVWAGYPKPVGNVVIPDSVQYGGQWFRVLALDNGAFYSCTAISSITLPYDLRYIGKRVFSGCSSLGSINLESTRVYEIGRNAFYNCSSLHEIAFPQNVTVIDTLTFYNCTSLRKVTIPENIDTIKYHAFSGCDNIDTLLLNADSCIMSDGWVYFPFIRNDDVDYIYPEFVNTTMLNPKHIIIGDDVTVFDDFRLTTSTGSLYDGNSWYAYYGYTYNSNLKSITYGRNVHSMGAFSGNGLESITFKGTTPPIGYVSYLTSNSIISAPCYIPCGTTATYRNALPFLTNFVEAEGPSFSAVSEDNSKGAVQILNMPTCTNPNAVVNAIPANGYIFDHWSDGSTLNPYSLTITDDTELIAYFISTTGINDVAHWDGIELTVLGTILSMQGTQGETVNITDIMGRPVYNGHSTGELRIELPSSGVYFVRVGERPARKVMAVR